MRASLYAALMVLLLLTSCRSKSDPSQPEPAPGAPLPPPASAEAPVPEGIQALRDADAAFQRGELEVAAERAQAAAKALPQSPMPLNLIGRVHFKKFTKSTSEDDAQKARDAFNQAIRLGPDFWPALQNLGELDEMDGRFETAASAYQRLLKAQPQHPQKAHYEAVIAKAAPAKKAK